jgi:hypothetical protein
MAQMFHNATAQMIAVTSDLTRQSMLQSERVLQAVQQLSERTTINYTVRQQSRASSARTAAPKVNAAADQPVVAATVNTDVNEVISADNRDRMNDGNDAVSSSPIPDELLAAIPLPDSSLSQSMSQSSLLPQYTPSAPLEPPLSSSALVTRAAHQLTPARRRTSNASTDSRRASRRRSNHDPTTNTTGTSSIRLNNRLNDSNDSAAASIVAAVSSPSSSHASPSQ